VGHVNRGNRGRDERSNICAEEIVVVSKFSVYVWRPALVTFSYDPVYFSLPRPLIPVNTCKVFLSPTELAVFAATRAVVEPRPSLDLLGRSNFSQSVAIIDRDSIEAFNPVSTSFMLGGVEKLHSLH